MNHSALDLLSGAAAALAWALLTCPPAAMAQEVHYGCGAPVKLDQFSYDDLGHMGQSIAIGDFNDDGTQDVVLGGYDREQVPSNEADDLITRVYVFLGTGSSTSPVFRERLEIKGVQALDLFGFSLAFIADLNGDECDELVVGSPRSDAHSLTDSGRVWLFYGRPDLSAQVSGPPEESNAVAAAALSFDGLVNGGWFGASLATAKGEGGAYLKNFLVGAPGNSIALSSTPGAAFLYEPAVMDAAAELAIALPGIAVGANPSTGTPGITGSGSLGYLVTANRALPGLAGGDCFGQSVAFVGDLDGTAGQEFLVGAPQYASESGSPSTKGPGYVQVFRTTSQSPALTIWGEQAPSDEPRQEGEAFGFAVAGGLSLNPPNTVPDLLIGAPLFNVDATGGPGTGDLKAGRVRAFTIDWAATGGPQELPLLLDSPEVNGTIMFGTSGDQFGYAVTLLPDINGDQGPEILVGAWQGSIASVTVCLPPHTPPLRSDKGGYADLYTSGGPTGVPAKIVTFYGESGGDHMGRAVGAADLFGSGGIPEIVLSGVAWTPFGFTAPQDPTELGRGYVWDGDTVLP